MTQKDAQAAARQKAEQAREQRSQSNAQRTAAEIRENVGSMSPEVAASMGPALDPSKGFSFDPNARPADLPEPGQSPGGGEQRSNQQFAGNMIGNEMEDGPGLPDDHDNLVGPGIGGGPQPQQQPPQAQRPEPQFKAGEIKPEHPILSKLRLDLGIDKIRTHDVTIGDHKWTLRMVAPGELAMASRIADSVSETVTEQTMVYRAAIVAYAIVAIDGVPTYQVFGIDAPPGVPVTDHFRPPKVIRHLAANLLYNFIQEDSRTALPDKLFDAYEDKCDQAGAVSSYLDEAEKRRMRFRCEEENCGHELYIVPQMKIGTNDIQLPFCQWHGTAMPIVGAEVDGGDVPLA